MEKSEIISIITAIAGSGIISSIITIALNFWFDKARNKNEIEKQKFFKVNETKIQIHALVIDMMANCLSEIQEAFYKEDMKNFLNTDAGKRFNNLRMKTYGYISIYGSQESLTAHEKWVSYILDTVQGKINGNWNDMRDIVNEIINSFRKDFDPNSRPIEYIGNR